MYKINEEGQIQGGLAIGLGFVGLTIGVAVATIVYQAGLVNTALLSGAQSTLWALFLTILFIVAVVAVLNFIRQ